MRKSVFTLFLASIFKKKISRNFFGGSVVAVLCVASAFAQTENGSENVASSERSSSSPSANSVISTADLPLKSEDSESLADLENSSSESKAFAPLYDAPEKLRRLDKTAPIWVSTDRKNVVLGGTICLREGPLEFFACRRGSKEHESIVSLDVAPHLIHAALLAIGAKQGAPAKFDPIFVPPTGEEIEIEVCWRDAATDEIRKTRAQELVLEENSGKTMTAPWVFTGGLFGVDAEGKKYYLANVTGEIFGVANFPGSVLDVPLESSSDNSNLYYSPNTPKIPPVGTQTTLILSRKIVDNAAKTSKTAR